MRAAVLLLGPALEPEGCWGLGDPASITARCLDALEACRFDKVRAGGQQQQATCMVAVLMVLSGHHWQQGELLGALLAYGGRA